MDGNTRDSPIQYAIYTGTKMLRSHIKDWKTTPLMVFTIHILLRKTGGWGFLSFGRIVGYHWYLCIELHKSMVLGFWQHDIIPLKAQNLRLEDPRTINKFNGTIHTSFFKHDIYQKVHYLHNRSIYPLRAHFSKALERLDVNHQPYAWSGGGMKK